MLAAQGPARPRNACGIKPRAVGEGHQETLVAEHMVEDAAKKARLARRVADRVRADAGRGEEGAEPLRFLGDEGKRLNRKRFCRFSGFCHWRLHRVPFAFP